MIDDNVIGIKTLATYGSNTRQVRSQEGGAVTSLNNSDGHRVNVLAKSSWGLYWLFLLVCYVLKGLFMALQPKIIACGNSVATFAMAVRFLTGPAVMAAASIAVGLRGTLLHVAIVQVIYSPEII